MFLKIALGFIAKCIKYKGGSLLAVSLLTSTSLTLYIGQILKGTDPRNLIIPILVHCIGFTVFMLFTTADFVTGLQNARFQYLKAIKQQKIDPKTGYLRSHKLWRTLWKILGILLLTSMITLIVLFAEIVGSTYAWYVGIWSELGLWVLACGFEFHSIGENIQKRCGEKPDIFKFWDKVLDAMQKRAIKKISNGDYDNEQDDNIDDQSNTMGEEENPDKPA